MQIQIQIQNIFMYTFQETVCLPMLLLYKTLNITSMTMNISKHENTKSVIVICKYQNKNLEKRERYTMVIRL